MVGFFMGAYGDGRKPKGKSIWLSTTHLQRLIQSCPVQPVQPDHLFAFFFVFFLCSKLSIKSNYL